MSSEVLNIAAREKKKGAASGGFFFSKLIWGGLSVAYAAVTKLVEDCFSLDALQVCTARV